FAERSVSSVTEPLCAGLVITGASLVPPMVIVTVCVAVPPCPSDTVTSYFCVRTWPPCTKSSALPATEKLQPIEPPLPVSIWLGSSENGRASGRERGENAAGWGTVKKACVNAGTQLRA